MAKRSVDRYRIQGLRLVAAGGGQGAILDPATVRPTIDAYFDQLRFRDQGHGIYRMTPTATTPSYYAFLLGTLTMNPPRHRFRTGIAAGFPHGTRRLEFSARKAFFTIFAEAPHGTPTGIRL